MLLIGMTALIPPTLIIMNSLNPLPSVSFHQLPQTVKCSPQQTSSGYLLLVGSFFLVLTGYPISLYSTYLSVYPRIRSILTRYMKINQLLSIKVLLTTIPLQQASCSTYLLLLLPLFDLFMLIRINCMDCTVFSVRVGNATELSSRLFFSE